jgi:tetratricopeptide (TPR) repeat protein
MSNQQGRWSRSEVLALGGVVVAVIALVPPFLSKDVRCFLFKKDCETSISPPPDSSNLEPSDQSAELVPSQPTTADGWFTLGSSLEMEGRYEEAAQAYEQSLGIVDESSQACRFCAWYGKGRCHEQLGRLHEAIRSYTAALNLDPYHPDANNVRQQIIYLQDRLQYN